MSTTQIAYNATTKEVKLQMPGDAPGSGFTDLGDVNHPDPDDVLEWSGNHVLWHHVRDALYKVGQENMQAVKITKIPLTGISVTPATTSKAVGATQQLTVAYAPINASLREVTYSTSDATKATVSASGLITAVAAGTATITATAKDGSWSDTCMVTVTA